MSEERLKEIKDSIHIAHRISCDPAISMDFRDKEELYNEVVRLRGIIDKANNEIEKYKYTDNWGDTVVLAKYLEDILKQSNLTLEQLTGVENE